MIQEDNISNDSIFDIKNSKTSDIDNIIIEDRIMNKNEYDYKSLLCTICKGLLVSPKSCVNCENLFCLKCKENQLNNDIPCKCSEKKYSKAHKFIVESLNKLIIQCKYHKNGCTTSILYNQLESHEPECDYSEITCQNEGCDKIMLLLELEEHLNQCNYKQVNCCYCNSTFKKLDINAHEDNCDFKSIKCTGCSGNFYLKEYKIHEESCEEIIISCQRCNFNYKKREYKNHDDYSCAMNNFEKIKIVMDSDLAKISKSVDYLEKQMKSYEAYFSISCRQCEKYVCEASSIFCIVCKSAYCNNCYEQFTTVCFKCKKHYCRDFCGIKNECCNICNEENN